MSDSTRVTGQPAPPTPQTPWFTVPAGMPGGCPVCDRTTCYDESHNPSRPQLAQLMEKAKKLAEGDPTYTTLIAIEGVIGEALRLLAAAQPLTPPQPPPARWHVGQELFCVEGCGDVRVTKVVYHEDVQTWFYYTSDPNDIDGHLEENLRLKITHKAAPPSLTAPPQKCQLCSHPRTLPTVEKLADTLREIDYMNWSAAEVAEKLLAALNWHKAASLTAEELAPLLPSKIYQQAGTYLMCRCCKAVSLFHRGWHDHDEDCVLAELLKAALPGIKVVRG